MTIKRKKPVFKLLPESVVDNSDLQEEVRESFRRAFFAKGMSYASELVYDSEECPASRN
jgi:hypothetical protein